MDFGSVGSASIDLNVNLSNLPGQFAQARERVAQQAVGVEQAGQQFAAAVAPIQAAASALSTLSPQAARVVQAFQQLVAAGDPATRLIDDFAKTLSNTGPAAADNARLLAELRQHYDQVGRSAQDAARQVQAAATQSRNAWTGAPFPGAGSPLPLPPPPTLSGSTGATDLAPSQALALGGFLAQTQKVGLASRALSDEVRQATTTLASVGAGTGPAVQGLQNVAAAAGAAVGAIGGGGGPPPTGPTGPGGGLAGAAGSAAGGFGLLNTSLASFAGYLGAIAVRKVIGDLEGLGSTAIADAEQWQLAAQKIQFSLGLTREAALRERAALMDASRGQPFGGTVQLATFLGPSVLEMGKTRAELNGLIKELGQLAIVSGSTGEQAQRAFTQLGQAFSIGKLQGQDLRALTQDMPALFDAIVRGSGKSREALVEMAHAVGGIPVSLVFEALQKEAPAVADAFAKMGSTVSVGLTDVKNAFLEAVGNAGAATDAVNTLGKAFEDLAGFMRTADFQTALAPFATFIHDLGTGLSESIKQVHDLMDLMAKSAAGGPAGAPDLGTTEGLTAHAKAIGEGLANPPPLTPVRDALVGFQERHLPLPGDDPSKAQTFFDLPAYMRSDRGAAIFQGEVAPAPAAPWLGGAMPPPDLSSRNATPERFSGGPVSEAHGPGLSQDEKARLAADVGAILQRAAAGPVEAGGQTAKPAKVEMVGSTEQGPIDRLQAFLANLLTGGAAGEAGTSGAQLGAWLRGREGPQAGPGTLGAVAQAFPQPFDAGRPGATVAEVAKPPVTLSDEQWKALAGLNFVASMDVFHGTGAAPFAKFDASKIGTGEGNQTYGYGHYFAENEATGKGYQTQLSGGRWETNEGQLSNGDLQARLRASVEESSAGLGGQPAIIRSIADNLLQAIQDSGSVAAAVEKNRLASVPGGMGKGYAAAIEKATELDVKPNAGTLFGAKLDVEPGQLLDLDKPLREQSREVKDALERLVADLRAVDPESHAARDMASGRPSGQTFYSNLTSDLSQDLAGKDPARASESLRQAGIPGLQYLDQGSRAQGDGSHNVVIFPGEESRIGIASVNGQPVPQAPSPPAGTGLPALAAALGLGAIGATSLGAGQAKAGEEESAARAETEAQAALARLRELLAQGDAMLARASQVDAAREALAAGPQGPPTAPTNPAALYPGAHEGAEATRPMPVEEAVRSAVDGLVQGLKAAPGEVAQAWRDAAARTAPAPLGTPPVEAAGADAAKTAAEARAQADQETAAKARESGTALEQAGQDARQAGAAQGAVANAGERVVGSFTTLAAATHRLVAMLGGVVLPPEGTPRGDGAAKEQGVPAAKPEQPGPTPELLGFAKLQVETAQKYVAAHPVEKGQDTELAASYRSILVDAATSVVEKARKIQSADLQQAASMEATRYAESNLQSYKQRGDRLTPVPGQEDIVQTQAAITKREAANKDLVAQREELARLKALEKDALASPGLVSPERLSAIQASRAETQGKVTALEQRERAQQLATFTHGSEQEAASAAGRIFDKTTTTDPRDALLLQLKQDKAGIASATAAKDTEGVQAATKTLLADQTRLAEYDQRRKDALASQRESLTGQASATERLTNDLEKIARAQRTQPGDSGPALAKASDVTAAKDAAFKRFAAGIEQEAGKDNQGKPERERAEAAIAALLAAETGHVGARAVLEERIAQIKGRVGELDKADLERLEAQNATIETSLAKSQAKLSRLKAGAGGDIQGAIDDAREAARDSVPSLTKEEAASTHGPEFEVRRDVQREQAGDTAAEAATLTQRLAALKSVATAEYTYMEVVKEADARRKAGLITEQQYNRAVQGTITPLQAYREEMARIGAVEANVNLAVLKGTMSLDERRRKMLQLEGDKGRAAAGERAAATRDLYDSGEAGSGTPFGQQVANGALAGGMDFITEHGNAAKDAGQLVKTSLEGASDALAQYVMTGKADLASLGVSLEQMAIKMTIQLLLARALGAALGGILGGGGGGASGAGGGMPAGFGDFAAGGFKQSAHGNAFEGGAPVPMEHGGILARETMIPMRHGGFADANEVPGNTEGVLPLKRNARGDLGVQTDGGGGGSAPSIVINNHGEPVGQSDTKWDPDSRTFEVTIRKMVDNNIAGGAHNRAMKSAFGLTPTVRR